MKIGRKNKAQSFLEYAILICVLVAGFIGMRIYFVRAVQEKYRQAADVFGEGEQYAKGVTQFIETSSGLDIAEPPEGPDICANVRSQVETLEKNITDLVALANGFENLASQMRQQASISSSAGFADAGAQEAQLTKMADDFENRALGCRQEVAEKEGQIAQLKIEYTDCF